MSSLCPVMLATFWVATTLPVTRPTNIGSMPRGLGSGRLAVLQEVAGLAGDDDLLVGRDRPDLHARPLGRDERLARGVGVLLGVERDAEPVQVPADFEPHADG